MNFNFYIIMLILSKPYNKSFDLTKMCRLFVRYITHLNFSSNIQIPVQITLNFLSICYLLGTGTGICSYASCPGKWLRSSQISKLQHNMSL